MIGVQRTESREFIKFGLSKRLDKVMVSVSKCSAPSGLHDPRNIAHNNIIVNNFI